MPTQAKIIEKGANYLPMLEIEGGLLPLKKFVRDPVNKTAYIEQFDQEAPRKALVEFLNKHRIEQKKSKDKKKENEQYFNSHSIYLYESYENEDGLKFKVCEEKDGYKHPFDWELCLPADYVEIASAFKRIIPLLSDYFYLIEKWKLFIGFPLLPKLGRIMLDMSHFILSKFFLDETGYTRFGKEIYRVFNKIGMTELVKKFVDIGIFFLEFDLAYRNRVKDLFGEVDKTKFIQIKKTKLQKLFTLIEFLRFKKVKKLSMPTKEISRLFDIMIERDYDAMKIKWDKIKRIVLLVLELKPEIINYISKFIQEVNLEKVKMSDLDYYWASYGKDYHYAGKFNEIRNQDRINKYGR